MLLDKVPNLGMIVDLTNTDRYYDPNFFKSKGIQYIKLMLPGHGTAPDKKSTKAFRLDVKRFLNANKNNDKLIGVHCTHGLNRTGFLICDFMIKELKIKPKKAVESFEVARGHKIERENYVHLLCSRNNDSIAINGAINQELNHRNSNIKESDAVRPRGTSSSFGKSERTHIFFDSSDNHRHDSDLSDRRNHKEFSYKQSDFSERKYQNGNDAPSCRNDNQSSVRSYSSNTKYKYSDGINREDNTHNRNNNNRDDRNIYDGANSQSSFYNGEGVRANWRNGYLETYRNNYYNTYKGHSNNNNYSSNHNNSSYYGGRNVSKNRDTANHDYHVRQHNSKYNNDTNATSRRNY